MRSAATDGGRSSTHAQFPAAGRPDSIHRIHQCGSRVRAGESGRWASAKTAASFIADAEQVGDRPDRSHPDQRNRAAKRFGDTFAGAVSVSHSET
jgi:hypothetical protein